MWGLYFFYFFCLNIKHCTYHIEENDLWKRLTKTNVSTLALPVIFFRWPCVLFRMNELTSLQMFSAIGAKTITTLWLNQSKPSAFQQLTAIVVSRLIKKIKQDNLQNTLPYFIFYYTSRASLLPKYWGPWWAHSVGAFVKYYHLFYSLFPISTSSILIYSSNGPRPYKPLRLCRSKWCLIPDYTNLWVRWYFFCLVQE